MRHHLFKLFVFLFLITGFIGCERHRFKNTISYSPEWAKQAVWYQIFPERFRNGDPSNDPKLADIFGSWPHDSSASWAISNWTGDWYALQSWETLDDKGFYYHVQRRRYGGDIQGIINKLDYLEDLGINAIYLNPVFESPSLHKYDAEMYHHIDNNFGPKPDGDRHTCSQENHVDPNSWQWTSADSLFLQLIQNCHEREIHIIIDGVFNHVGLNFWAFRDIMKRGEKSPYKDWFRILQWDDPSTPDNEFEYNSWMGVKELPEFQKDENGIVNGPRQYIEAVVKRWMDPNNDGDPSDGIDGWRLDVAEMINRAFWREFRKWVRDINPEAYLVGEVWWEKWPEKMYNARPWLEGDVFDAVMNYRLANLTQQFFIDQKNKISAGEFNAGLKKLRDDYPIQVNYTLLNVLDSHDTDRLASNIVNPDYGYDARVSPKDDINYNIRKPSEDEIQIQKLIVLFQMTYIGAPTVYYGDEAGMWGGDDPDCRKPMLWPDMVYADEVSDPFGRSRPKNENKFNYDLHDYYKKLIQIRRDHPALMLGDFKSLFTSNTRNVCAYERTYKGDKVVVVLNNSEQTQHMYIKSKSINWIDLIGGQAYHANDNVLNLRLGKKSGLVLAYEN